MKSLWDNESFCADAFVHELPNDLKEQTVGVMLKAARMSRRRRDVGRALAAVGIVVAGLALVIASKPHRETPPASLPNSTGWQVVRTVVMPPEMVVHTEPDGSLIVRTEIQGTYDVLTDEEVFEIFRDRGVALVKMGNVTKLYLGN